MRGVGAQVRPRRIGQRVEHAQASLHVARAVVAARLQVPAKSQQALRGDAGRGTVDRLVVVERIGGTVLPPRQVREPGCAGVPVGDAVTGRALLDVEVAGRPGGFAHEPLDGVSPRKRLERLIGNRREKLQLLGKPEHRPRQAPRPGAEGRVALLAVGPAERAVDGVEDRFVRRAPAHVVVVPAPAVVDAEAGRGLRVLHQALEQADLRVLFLAEPVAEPMPESQRSQRADGIDEERVGAVERVNEPAIGQARPAPGLHGAADLQRQLVEVALPLDWPRTAPLPPGARGCRRC